MNRPLRVAVVGSGPSGMYAAGHLLEGPGGTYLNGQLVQLIKRPIEVDVFDRLPTQWGLVRNGVAPDHPEKKLAQTVFEQVAARPGFRFFGNVEVGKHVQADELSQWYDAVVYAHGATGEATLKIAGENLPGCLSARQFVAWYNGHPDYRHLALDFAHERAVIVGNGNVALDVARILVTPIDVLARTDIADHALEALRESKIREVVVLGRRGPENAAFSFPELSELGELSGVDLSVEGAELAVSGVPAVERKLAALREFAGRGTAGHDRRIVLRFLASPVAVLGDERVTGLLVAHQGEQSVVATGLVLSSIGYFGTPLPGLPFDEARGIVPNQDGRVEGVPGAYVTGWIKRGPRGIIGTNKKCARDTVRSLLADADADALPVAGTLAPDAVESLLVERQPQLVDQRGWMRIDAVERATGRGVSRPRVKLTDTGQLLAAAAG